MPTSRCEIRFFTLEADLSSLAVLFTIDLFPSDELTRLAEFFRQRMDVQLACCRLAGGMGDFGSQLVQKCLSEVGLFAEEDDSTV